MNSNDKNTKNASDNTTHTNTNNHTTNDTDNNKSNSNPLSGEEEQKSPAFAEADLAPGRLGGAKDSLMASVLFLLSV